MKSTNRVKASFYQWIQEDVDREISSNLYFLRRIKGDVAIRTCHYLDSLEPSRREESLKALSKKILISNEDVIGVRPTEFDKERWQEFSEAVIVNPIDLEYIEHLYKEALATRKNFAFQQLRTEIKVVCEPFMGKPVSNKGKVFYYETYIKNFRICTEFDLGGWSRLRYLHSVSYEDPASGKRSRVIMTDFLRWLGMGQTAWEFISNEDIPGTASIVGELCQSFMQGIRQIIDGTVD